VSVGPSEATPRLIKPYVNAARPRRAERGLFKEITASYLKTDYGAPVNNVIVQIPGVFLSVV
jgi:hypothetical protein